MNSRRNGSRPRLLVEPLERRYLLSASIGQWSMFTALTPPAYTGLSSLQVLVGTPTSPQVALAANLKNVTGAVVAPAAVRAVRSITADIVGVGLPGLRSDIHVTLSRFDGGTATIDPNAPTWLIIHGRNSSASAANITKLANAVSNYATGDQVLTLDWSEGAKDNSSPIWDYGLQGSRWIAPVAKWAADRLRDLGITASRLSEIGHSWGAHIANEIARELARAVPGAKVRSLVALDPATLTNYYTGGTPNFKLNSNYSWAFNSSFPYGNNGYANTAHESFDVTVGAPSTVEAHSNVVDLFATLVDINNSQSMAVANRFSLGRLLCATPGPWMSNLSGFEASLYGTYRNARWEPLAIQYGSIREVVSADRAGDTLGQAYDFSTLSGTRTAQNWVGTANTVDCYKFRITSTRTVKIKLDGLSDNADLYLLDSAGRVINWSINSGSSIDSLSPNLTAGIYYLKVVPIGYANTYYNLSVTA